MSKYNLEDINQRKANGESWQQIAVIYNTTVPAVKRAYQRLKKKAKKEIVTSDISRPEPEIRTRIAAIPKTKRIKYPLSIDQVDRLLQANKDHYWYEYLNKMINKPGKLRADFEKLLVLIRDRA